MDALSLQLLFNGLALGAGYGLLALGFALALRSAGAINFAHGDVAVAAAYVAVAGGALGGLGGPAAAGLAIAAGALLGLSVAGLSWAPLRNRPIEATFIAAIAIGMVLQNALTVSFGGAPQAPAQIASGGVHIGAVFMSWQALISLGAAAIAFIAVWAVLAKSQVGRRMRAAAEDPEIAAAHGIPVIRLAILAFAVAGALAGLAGVLLAAQHYATPGAGADYILKAYVAATAAGWGRILPTTVAAVAIALFETIGAALVSYAVAEALLYAGFVALLAFRPQGLGGEAKGKRA